MQSKYPPKTLVPDCRLFSGYKPCVPFKLCEGCQDRIPMGARILLVNLDALGTVLATTAQLPAIKRSYPNSHITWITRKNALPLLANNPFIDHLVEWNDENRMVLLQQKFELALNADKSRPAAAFMNLVNAETKRGFGLNENGAIVPLNAGAEYSFRLGVDDHFKFRVNKRTGNDILAEAWEIEHCRDEYVLQLTAAELAEGERWREELGLDEAPLVIGINTGCSELFALKKLELETQAEVIRQIAAQMPEAKIILLGGREDTERNQRLVEMTDGLAIATPTTLGLRAGLILENLADIVVSGDSLGMHIAIALKKYVVAWFGLSCAAEVDLYNRGVKIIRDLPCAPCWKKVCDMPHGPICVTEFKPAWIVGAVREIYDRLNSTRDETAARRLVNAELVL
ncbi:MAG: glycosyltransferase family 9 protein [candidate division KSB1 bacterium]|nr:glycosyltransferase family 9 protein [candidate division KSB1 bacterium]MDZ7368310.1 glycosyltransferase family 9 protein [candidate division KSB1 bacterium]MDZ7406110.1 glycosyltransferase family 9 protein [candidate division KSB1 bacterium]